ncbi:MAG TPA: hypothetical protein VFQ00_04565 [Terriglobales bacterium]|nr:hypothetical protein [Terriglobales bacterium]
MHRTLENCLWLTPAVLEVLLLTGMIWRKLSREFPAFSCYLGFEVARTAVLFSLRAHYSRYFYTYWISEALAYLLIFWLIQEAFLKTFTQNLGMQKFGSVLFRCALFSLLIAALFLAYSDRGNDSSRLVAEILVIDRVLTLVKAGMIGCLFFLTLILAVPWRQLAFGIVAGLALSVAADLVLLALRARYGRAANGVFTWTTLIVSNCQKLLWVCYFLLATRRPPVRSLRIVDGSLTEWNEAALLTLEE